jgi:hypothetical protein
MATITTTTDLWSPFYGLDKVEVDYDDDEESESDGSEEEGKKAEEQENENGEEYDDDEDYEDEDEEEEQWFDIKSRVEPLRAIPMPERLHVDIHQFYIPPSGGTGSESESLGASDAADADAEEESESNTITATPTTTKIGTIHLSKDIFGCYPIRTDILIRVVQYQRNKKRGKRYPAYSKTISEVSGSGRKVRPQKGGGTARAGHKRPPHWRGGAKAHGE